jgi:hypothetical protein
VTAVRGKDTMAQNGTVLALYGKLMQLRFADANTGWVLLKSIEPPGAIQPLPPGDTCEREVGDKVASPHRCSANEQ